jgi:hypothetical protein
MNCTKPQMLKRYLEMNKMSYTKPQMLKLFTTEELMHAIVERDDRNKAFSILSTSFLGQMLESKEEVEGIGIDEDTTYQIKTSVEEYDWQDGPARILVVH